MKMRRKKRVLVLNGLKIAVCFVAIRSIAAIGEAILHLKSVKWERH